MNPSMSSSVVVPEAPAAPPVARPAPRPPGRTASGTIRLVPGRIRRSAGPLRLISPVAILVLWQLASASGLLPAQRLAGPGTILRTAWNLIQDGTLPQALAVSVQRVAIGAVVGCSIGILLGLVAGLSRWGDTLLDPPLQMLRTLPFLGLVPLLILWFGIGEVPKIVLISLGCTFPLYLNTYAGIRSVDRRLLDLAASLRLTRWELIRAVILPGALPQVLVGLRYGLGVAWLSLIVAEQVNANAGLGQMIMDARDFIRTDVIVVGLLVYALLGLLTDAAVRLVERRALAWRS
jgi:sulfonate transport system permease protein